MSELTENLADWPRDPYRLLSVEYDVTPRDLKRAYAKLIRRFKPEQYPEQFRRLREAYEIVLAGADRETTNEPSIFDPVRPDQRMQFESEAPARPSDPLEAAWESALTDGDIADAYAKLREAVERENGPLVGYIRLYWLRVLFPEVDRGRSRVDWLLTSLKLHRFEPMLMEALKREGEADPNLAIDPRCEAVVLAEPVVPCVNQFLEWRWSCALRARRPSVIAHDWPHARTAIARLDEKLWLYTVSTLCEELAWRTEANPELNRARSLIDKELKSLEPLAMRFPEPFDRCDTMRLLHAEVHALTELEPEPLDFRRMLRTGWLQGVDAALPDLEQTVADCRKNPGDWLSLFDRMTHGMPMLLNHFGNLLMRYGAQLQGVEDSAPDPDRRQTAILQAFRRIDHRQYPTIRWHVPTIALAEWIDYDALIASTANLVVSGNEGTRPLSFYLAEDGQLRLVCHAARLSLLG